MFEKLKKNIDKGIVSVSVKSSSYLETEKLKAKIDNIKSDSASQLQAMGDQIYQTWKENGTVDQAYIAEVCGKVQENEKEIVQLKNRFHDLAEKSFRQGIYTFTGFLGLGEQDVFWREEPTLR